jgi:phosphoribosylanthranilate isomerase
MSIDFQIKICGLTRVEDVREAAAAGADAIGINFYAGSRRFVEPRNAQHLVAAAPRKMTKVGVFVNADVETVCGIYDALGLDLIQLHGDEPPEFLAELGNRPIIRAFRVDDRGLAPVAAYLAECVRLNSRPRAVLLDAYHPNQFGGTGQPADWPTIAAQRHLINEYPLVLAGGLTPQNVATAIKTVQPTAVDTASGVESQPGHKDPDQMQQFVSAARTAFSPTD